mgnify:CR=1 FL=1
MIILGEAEKMMKVMVKLQKRQRMKMIFNIAIAIIFTMVMLWRAIYV